MTNEVSFCHSPFMMLFSLYTLLHGSLLAPSFKQKTKNV